MCNALYKLYILKYLRYVCFIILLIPQISFSYSKSVLEKIDQEVDEMSRKDLIGQKFIVGPPWLLPLNNSDNLKTTIESANKFSEKQLDILINDLRIGNFYISKTL